MLLTVEGVTDESLVIDVLEKLGGTTSAKTMSFSKLANQLNIGSPKQKTELSNALDALLERGVIGSDDRLCDFYLMSS